MNDRTVALGSGEKQSLDVRRIHPSERHQIIFGAFDRLAVGGVIEIIAGHEPLPLVMQFRQRRPGAFQAEFSKGDAGTWKLLLKKTSESPSISEDEGGCCGMCGGH